jgi:2-polyprenyl-3-methyl-5-hydroxy-6-metoxy-1,4-benzoquinol methylase
MALVDSDRKVFHYDNEIDLCRHSTHTKVLSFVGQRRRVLELGCSTGQMTRVMQERGCQVVAIEADAEAAKQAAEHCEHMIVGDLEQIDLDVELGDRRFDVIVAADVLEHLKAPETVLAALRPFLAPGGYLVASVPNVTHGSVRLALLGGSFPYADTGLLDRTHLRFYNRASLTEMLSTGRFSPVHLETIDLEITGSEVPFDVGPQAQAFLDALADQLDARTYQFVVVAYPTTPPLGPIPILIADLNARLHDLTYRMAVQAAEHRVTLNAAREEATRLRADVAQLAASDLDKDGLVAALQRQTDELRTSLDRQDVALREIHASKLWRVATVYRAVVAALRRR